MKNIATLAAQNRERLSKSYDTWSAFNTIVDILTEEQKLAYRGELAKLYLEYFKPAKTDNKSLPIMKALGMFVGKKDLRTYLNWIAVNEKGVAVASDGHTLLMTNLPTEMTPGFYDPKLGTLAHDIEFAKYPKFEKVFSDFKYASTIDINVPLEAKVITPKKGKPYEVYRMHGEWWYCERYIQRLRKAIPNGHFEINKLGTLKGHNDELTGVVMSIAV